MICLNSSYSQTTVVLQLDSTLGIDVIIDPYYPTFSDNMTPEFYTTKKDLC